MASNLLDRRSNRRSLEQLFNHQNRHKMNCPVCYSAMQLNGQVVHSNAAVKQRFTCRGCQVAGIRPYNYFVRIPNPFAESL